MKDKKTTEKMVRITAWIPQRKLKSLASEHRKGLSQSEILRDLVDEEVERIQSFKAHQKLYGIASSKDFR